MSVAIIPDFVKYQIEWLTSHDDLEFEPAIKDAIVQMLQDTGKSFIDEQAVETSQIDHIAESGRMVERTAETAQNVSDSDLVYREAAIEAIAKQMPRSYTPDGSHPADEEIFKAQEIYVDCIESIEILPAVQPDHNADISEINKFIDGLEEILADIRERHVDDSVCGLCEYDGAYMGQSGDWCNECPGFDKDDCFKLSDETRKKWIEEIVNTYPDHAADIGKKVSISCGRENDLISRQAAIDALWKALYEYEDETEKQFLESEELDVGEWIGHRIFVQNMNDIDRQTILNLPSAQPETNCSEIPNGSDDTISRQMAIDALDEQIEQCNKALGSFDISPKDEYAIKVEKASLKAYKEQLENIPAAQPEQKTDEWIPISKETNPTKSGWYLVTVHEDATNDNERFTGMAEFNATNGMWYDIDEPTDMYLRWMPLPAPYRGGGKE